LFRYAKKQQKCGVKMIFSFLLTCLIVRSRDSSTSASQSFWEMGSSVYFFQLITTSVLDPGKKLSGKLDRYLEGGLDNRLCIERRKKINIYILLLLNKWNIFYALTNTPFEHFSSRITPNSRK
jgi:hypothetical protein